MKPFATTLKLLDPTTSGAGRMSVAPAAAPAELTVPEHLLSHVVCAGGEGGSLTLYVDQRSKSAAAFQTWLQRLDESAITYSVTSVTAAELERHRRQHATTASDDLSLAMQQEARLLLKLVDAAGISDGHVLQRRDHTEVQVRVDGDLMTSNRFSFRAEEGARFVGAIYNGLASNKPPSLAPREFQDALIDGHKLAGTGLSTVRIIRGPAEPVNSGGGFLIARFQSRPGAKRTMSRAEAIHALQLTVPAIPDTSINGIRWRGFPKSQVARIIRLGHMPHGLVAFTGPVGSGKTQAMDDLLQYLAERYPGRRQVTIEDPPEFEKPWAIVLPVNGMTYLELLHKTLRMDPNILLMAEIRTAAEAAATLQAALTGRLVLTTSHVTDPFRFFQRLEDLDPHQLAKAKTCDHEQVIGVIGVRLVPQLCPDCRVRLLDTSAHEVAPDVVDALLSWGGISQVHVRGAGCPTCLGRGVTGRQVIAEVVETDELLMADVRNRPIAEVKRAHHARPDSDYSMLAYAVAHVLAGRVDPTDAHAHIALRPRRDERLPSIEELMS